MMTFSCSGIRNLECHFNDIAVVCHRFAADGLDAHIQAGNLLRNLRERAGLVVARNLQRRVERALGVDRPLNLDDAI
ncbi:MAG: hypothetical protein R2881_02470 [Eubacteriales bacterium]